MIESKAAKLTTFVAGDRTAIERCNQLFNAYCQKIIDVGKEHALPNRLKLSANYILLTLIDLMEQLFTVGEKSNISALLFLTYETRSYFDFVL